MLKVALALYFAPHLYLGWTNYGWSNSLWVCAIGLQVLVVAVLVESPLLASIALVGALPLQALWSTDLIAGLLLGITPFNLADWILAGDGTPMLRLRALFHVWAPLLAVWTVRRTGFSARARDVVVVGAVPVVLVSALATSRAWGEANTINLNLVKGPSWMPGPLWLLVVVIAYGLLTIAAHAVCTRLYPRRDARG